MDDSYPDKYLMAYGQHLCRVYRKKIYPDDHAISKGKQYYHIGCWEKTQS